MAFEVVIFVAGPFEEILEFVVLDSRVEGTLGTFHSSLSSRITGGGGGWQQPGVTSGGAGSRS